MTFSKMMRTKLTATVVVLTILAVQLIFVTVKPKNDNCKIYNSPKRTVYAQLTYNVCNCEIYHSPKRTVFGRLPYTVSKDSTFDYKGEMDKLNKERVKADDARLVHLLRNYYIEPPSQEPYKLQDPGRRDQSYGQAMFIDGTLRNMEGGFFVDSGAHDGEIQSNTMFFERIRHWTGILIEPQPEIYRKLKSKHRKSFHLNACVSVEPYPSKAQPGLYQCCLSIRVLLMPVVYQDQVSVIASVYQADIIHSMDMLWELGHIAYKKATLMNLLDLRNNLVYEKIKTNPVGKGHY